MNEFEKELLWAMNEQLSILLRGEPAHEVTTTDGTSMELRALAETVNRLIRSSTETRPFFMALATGDLSVEPPASNQMIAPFRKLHANLRHLTWQTQQIAAGDLSQRAEFPGEFSVAFNALIEALKGKQEAEERLQYVSNHDTLTGVYNRTYFTEETARLGRGRRFPISIIMADLDRLKVINDTHGHATGDLLLQQAAHLLTMAVRGEDVVARIGGGEFAVILPDTDTEAAAKVLERIREEERIFNRGQDENMLGISLGLATARDRTTFDESLKRADQLMYEDKELRRTAVTGIGM